MPLHALQMNKGSTNAPPLVSPARGRIRSGYGNLRALAEHFPILIQNRDALRSFPTLAHAYGGATVSGAHIQSPAEPFHMRSAQRALRFVDRLKKLHSLKR